MEAGSLLFPDGQLYAEAGVPALENSVGDAGVKMEKELFCNQCGKRIQFENGLNREDYLLITKRWGYFSDKDGRQDTFCLCEKCYDKITAAFVLPVLEEEMTELV